MTRKPTPREQFEQTHRALRDAYMHCPRWDYESDGYGHDCCDAVADAKCKLDQARTAMRRAQARSPEG